MSGAVNWADDVGSSDEEDDMVEQQQQPAEQPKNDPYEVAPQSSSSTSSSSAPRNRQRNTVLPDRAPYVAFVSNLSYKLDRDAVGSFFHDGGCNVKDVTIQMRDGQPRGAALVEFHDRESLEKSLGAQGTSLANRAISIGVSDRSNRRPRENDRQNRGDRRDRDRDRDRDHGDRRDRDRNNANRDGGRGYKQDGRDNRDGGNWSRGETRDRGNKERTSPRGVPPIPTPSSDSTNTDAPLVRKKVELKPRQLPLDTSSEVNRNSSIFGEGKPREETVKATVTAVTKEVKSLTVDSEKANKDATGESTNGEDDKKKEINQKTPKDTNKKDKTNTPRDNKKDAQNSSKKNDKDRKEKNANPRKNNTPKSQERKTPTGSGDSKAKKGKSDNEVDSSEEAAKAKFLAANEKLQKATATVNAPKTKTPVNAFSALMSDDSDSDSN